MKLKLLRIMNFRSCKDVQVKIDGIHAIVGANNAGKSTILRALDFFFNPSVKKITEETFWNKETAKQIRIEALFSDLTNAEKESLSAYLQPNNDLLVSRVASFNNDSNIDNAESEDEVAIKISQEACKLVPLQEWLREDEINGDHIEAWWAKKDTLIINGQNFSALLGAKKPTVALWKTKAAEFAINNSKSIQFVPQWIPNPKGYAGVLKGNLPFFILVPSVREIGDETKASKTSPFGRLLQTITASVTEDKRKKIDLALGDISKQLNRIGGAERLPGISDEEKHLNASINKIFLDCDLELEFQTPSFQDLLGTPKIYVDDGFRGLIENKGQGMQRAAIFCILQRYADLVAGDRLKRNRTFIFGIEEPESYMHPQAQRTIRKVLKELSVGGDQVLFTTHSSWLVDVACFDEIIRTESKIEKLNERRTVTTVITQLSMDK